MSVLPVPASGMSQLTIARNCPQQLQLTKNSSETSPELIIGLPDDHHS